MRKMAVIFGIIGIIVIGFCAISMEAAQNDFLGTWVLDKEKTHSLPREVKGYTMVVTQDEQKLVVETKVDGGLRPPEYGSSLSGGYLGHSAGNGMAGAGPAAGTQALWVVNPTVTYPLDGETTQPFAGLANSTLKLKTKWGKDGKALDLSYVQVAPGGHSAMLTIKERWTLSAEGDGLKVQRSVVTAQGADTVVLVLKKGPSAPKPSQP